MELFTKIPEVIWGGFIATMASLVTTILINRNSTALLQKQLEHSSEQEAKAREILFKRDIYLEAVDGMTTLLNMVIAMSDLELSSENFKSECVKSSSVLARVHLVAKNELIQKIVVFESHFSAIFLDLLIIRSDLLKTKNEHIINQNIATQFAEKRDIFFKQIEQYGVEGTQDQRLYDVLVKNYTFSSSMWEEHTEESLKYQKMLSEQLLLFSKYCVEKSSELKKLIPDILFLVRDDLELPLDKYAYIEILNLNTVDFSKSFDNFLNEMRIKLQEEN